MGAEEQFAAAYARWRFLLGELIGLNRNQHIFPEKLQRMRAEMAALARTLGALNEELERTASC